MSNFKERYIGTREFYMHALAIAVPMIIQNLITNLVSMLDNIMVGQVGTAQMSGVSIANQYIFIFNITIFGAVSGAGIFGTQFFGKGDHEGQKYTFRFRLLMVAVTIAVFATVFSLFGDPMIRLFLSGDDSPAMIADTLVHGKAYLRIMILSLIPFGIGQAYSSVVRECGETKIPMIGSMAAIGINLFLDYGLIFGNFGMPRMGVEGAAIATVIAKCIEAGVVIGWAHTHHARNRYIVGLFRGFYIPWDLTKRIIIKGFPLLMNEFLWSLGMSIIAQSYSVRGIEVVAARNIASTLTNLLGVVYIQLGGCIGIIVGAELGAGQLEKAKEDARKLKVFAVFFSMIIGFMMLPIGFWFPGFYNTTPEIKALATFFITIQAFAMPMWSYAHCSYFTLRSGGKTGITFLFDFGFTWAVSIPLAFVLTHLTHMDIHWIIVILTYSELFKDIIGYYMVKSNVWVNNIVND